MPDLVRVEGLEELRDGLEDLEHGLEDLREPGQETGRALQTRAEQEAPKDTGTLAGNHGVEVRAGVVEVVNPTRYGPPVHARDPWLTRTRDALEDEVADIYTQHVDQLVDDVRGA